MRNELLEVSGSASNPFHVGQRPGSGPKPSGLKHLTVPKNLADLTKPIIIKKLTSQDLGRELSKRPTFGGISPQSKAVYVGLLLTPSTKTSEEKLAGATGVEIFVAAKGDITILNEKQSRLVLARLESNLETIKSNLPTEKHNDIDTFISEISTKLAGPKLKADALAAKMAEINHKSIRRFVEKKLNVGESPSAQTLQKVDDLTKEVEVALQKQKESWNPFTMYVVATETKEARVAAILDAMEKESPQTFLLGFEELEAESTTERLPAVTPHEKAIGITPTEDLSASKSKVERFRRSLVGAPISLNVTNISTNNDIKNAGTAFFIQETSVNGTVATAIDTDGDVRGIMPLTNTNSVITNPVVGAENGKVMCFVFKDSAGALQFTSGNITSPEVIPTYQPLGITGATDYKITQLGIGLNLVVYTTPGGLFGRVVNNAGVNQGSVADINLTVDAGPTDLNVHYTAVGKLVVTWKEGDVVKASHIDQSVSNFIQTPTTVLNTNSPYFVSDLGAAFVNGRDLVYTPSSGQNIGQAQTVVNILPTGAVVRPGDLVINGDSGVIVYRDVVQGNTFHTVSFKVNGTGVPQPQPVKDAPASTVLLGPIVEGDGSVVYQLNTSAGSYFLSGTETSDETTFLGVGVSLFNSRVAGIEDGFAIVPMQDDQGNWNGQRIRLVDPTTTVSTTTTGTTTTGTTTTTTLTTTKTTGSITTTSVTTVTTATTPTTETTTTTPTTTTTTSTTTTTTIRTPAPTTATPTTVPPTTAPPAFSNLPVPLQGQDLQGDPLVALSCVGSSCTVTFNGEDFQPVTNGAGDTVLTITFGDKVYELNGGDPAIVFNNVVGNSFTFTGNYADLSFSEVITTTSTPPPVVVVVEPSGSTASITPIIAGVVVGLVAVVVIAGVVYKVRSDSKTVPKWFLDAKDNLKEALGNAPGSVKTKTSFRLEDGHIERKIKDIAPEMPDRPSKVVAEIATAVSVLDYIKTMMDKQDPTFNSYSRLEDLKPYFESTSTLGLILNKYATVSDNSIKLKTEVIELVNNTRVRALILDVLMSIQSLFLLSHHKALKNNKAVVSYEVTNNEFIKMTFKTKSISGEQSFKRHRGLAAFNAAFDGALTISKHLDLGGLPQSDLHVQPDMVDWTNSQVLSMSDINYIATLEKFSSDTSKGLDTLCVLSAKRLKSINEKFARQQGKTEFDRLTFKRAVLDELSFTFNEYLNIRNKFTGLEANQEYLDKLIVEISDFNQKLIEEEGKYDQGDEFFSKLFSEDTVNLDPLNPTELLRDVMMESAKVPEKITALLDTQWASHVREGRSPQFIDCPQALGINSDNPLAVYGVTEWALDPKENVDKKHMRYAGFSKTKQQIQKKDTAFPDYNGQRFITTPSDSSIALVEGVYTEKPARFNAKRAVEAIFSRLNKNSLFVSVGQTFEPARSGLGFTEKYANSNGSFCLNPDDKPELRKYIYTADHSEVGISTARAAQYDNFPADTNIADLIETPLNKALIESFDRFKKAAEDTGAAINAIDLQAAGKIAYNAPATTTYKPLMTFKRADGSVETIPMAHLPLIKDHTAPGDDGTPVIEDEGYVDLGLEIYDKVFLKVGVEPVDAQADVVMHCSAGVGRSGIFALAELMASHPEKYMKRFSSYVDALNNLRSNRRYAIQNDKQFKAAIKLAWAIRGRIEAKAKSDYKYAEKEQAFKEQRTADLYGTITAQPAGDRDIIYQDTQVKERFVTTDLNTQVKACFDKLLVYSKELSAGKDPIYQNVPATRPDNTSRNIFYINTDGALKTAATWLDVRLDDVDGKLTKKILAKLAKQGDVDKPKIQEYQSELNYFLRVFEATKPEQSKDGDIELFENVESKAEYLVEDDLGPRERVFASFVDANLPFQVKIDDKVFVKVSESKYLTLESYKLAMEKKEDAFLDEVHTELRKISMVNIFGSNFDVHNGLLLKASEHDQSVIANPLSSEQSLAYEEGPVMEVNQTGQQPDDLLRPENTEINVDATDNGNLSNESRSLSASTCDLLFALNGHDGNESGADAQESLSLEPNGTSTPAKQGSKTSTPTPDVPFDAPPSREPILIQKRIKGTTFPAETYGPMNYLDAFIKVKGKLNNSNGEDLSNFNIKKELTAAWETVESIAKHVNRETFWKNHYSWLSKRKDERSRQNEIESTRL